MRLPGRHTLGLSAALLLAVVVGAWFLVPRSRITQANFDRVQENMKLGEVEQLLGKYDDRHPMITSWTGGTCTVLREWCSWTDGPNEISIEIDERGMVVEKEIKLATAWETLIWYAKKGAAKIGVKWD